MKRRFCVWLASGLLGIISQSAIHLVWARAPQAATSVPEGDGGSPKIVIWVYNYPGIPDRILTEAEKEVTRVLAKAGIDGGWVQCPVSAAEVLAHPACQDRMSARDLALTILPQFKASSRNRSDTFFGSSQVFSNGQFGHYAYVYYDRIEDAENRGGSSTYQILAAVALHEIGHLLLRSSAHSRTGLMRAQWDRGDLENAAQGQLCFTTQQAHIICAQVRARVEQEKNLAFSPPQRPARVFVPPRVREW